MRTLSVASYNIHKGLNAFNRRVTLPILRERLASLGADIVFLQEVVGRNDRHARRHEAWPELPQHQFLAEGIWPGSAYGMAAVYDHGHHGNAILSRFPIVSAEQEDISTNRVEQRGLLHALIKLPRSRVLLHCVCLHLGLMRRSRAVQLALVRERIERLVPREAPLIVAGDFNDWLQDATRILESLGMVEAFEAARGMPALTFPAGLPVLPLDRIYVRGLAVRSVAVHRGREWARLSDHAPITATLTVARAA
ncbi:MAG: endonuclease/exonuclease/phosphatase family protein [Casimicrobiaceae bacterium]|nr:endonuclease/exonuclease/phosphatase family protein [Casimicrobiaceae bacterium]MCX8098479.1 endonuclease/exonuclease/phosphatase family protein [Casimicrobiaceae bacterium]MDW8311583.1 endonuclease/exonuclease/phosphatase family protein [Burkholderiales bacterium]